MCLPFTQVHLTYKVDLMNLFRDKLDRISVRDLLTHLNPGVLSLWFKLKFFEKEFPKFAFCIFYTQERFSILNQYGLKVTLSFGWKGKITSTSWAKLFPKKWQKFCENNSIKKKNWYQRGEKKKKNKTLSKSMNEQLPAYHLNGFSRCQLCPVPRKLGSPISGHGGP